MNKTTSAVSTIVLAEDDADIRVMLKYFLESKGLRVVEAINGRDALDVVQREHPQLILMDLNMPVLDGAAAARIIREDDDLRNVPIVIITAHGELAIKFYMNMDGLAGGRIEYLTKPIDLDELGAIISPLLQQS